MLTWPALARTMLGDTKMPDPMMESMITGTPVQSVQSLISVAVILSSVGWMLHYGGGGGIKMLNVLSVVTALAGCRQCIVHHLYIIVYHPFLC